MKKKLAYVNEDSFIHVDMSILAGLAREYDVLWIPIITKGFADYTDVFLQDFADCWGISLRIERTSNRLRSLSNISFYARIARQINCERADLMFTAINNPYWAVISAFKLSMPIVQGFHDFCQHSGFNQKVALHLSANLISHLQKHFIFYSRSQLSLFNKKYPKKNAGYVGMTGLNYGNSNVTPPPISNGIRLLFFGRIDSYKGLDQLINSMESLYLKGARKIILTIRGRGSFWETCEPLMRHMELYDVDIRFVESAEIPDLFCSHHFLVLPYRDVTQSGPMMVALHYGLPVIAPAFPAFKEYCDQENSLLYQDGELMSALERSISISEEEYAALKNKWNAVSAKCTPSVIVQNYISFFSNLI